MPANREHIATLEIAKNLYKHLDEITEIKDYFGLLAAFAMAKVAVAGKDEEAMQIVKAYLNRYPDNINHPRYFFEMYRCGGNGRAFLHMMAVTPSCSLQAWASMSKNTSITPLSSAF